MNGNEIGLILKDPGWWPTGTQFSNLGGISGFGIPNGWANGSFAIIPASVRAGTPMLSGTVDLLPIFNWAATQGWISTSYVLNGFEFGVEPTNGSGSVTFNSLSCTVS
jgi:hypothetical protein